MTDFAPITDREWGSVADLTDLTDLTEFQDKAGVSHAGLLDDVQSFLERFISYPFAAAENGVYFIHEQGGQSGFVADLSEDVSNRGIDG